MNCFVRFLSAVTPPVITELGRKISARLSGKSDDKGRQYSTVDDPQEVPCQVEAYLFCRDNYLKPNDRVLEVGFGLGYGMQIMAATVREIAGLDVDEKAFRRAGRIFAGHPVVKDIRLYDGRSFPFADKSFDAVTCLEVLEHVPDYLALLNEMARVSRRLVFISTPNRRPEYTLRSGKPKNFWHLREWSKSELDAVFAGLNYRVEWNFLDGPFQGPFRVSRKENSETLTLMPAILVAQKSCL